MEIPALVILRETMCNCREASMCEMYGGACGRKADGFAWAPSTWQLPLRLSPKFACRQCWEVYCDEWPKPIKGITRPDNADEEWRPSLMDMMRHAEIAEKFEERSHKRVDVAQPRDADEEYWRLYETKRGFTPTQIIGFRFLRSRRWQHTPQERGLGA